MIMSIAKGRGQAQSYPPSQKTTSHECCGMDECENVLRRDSARTVKPIIFGRITLRSSNTKVFERSRVIQKGSTGLPVGLHNLCILS